MGIYDNEGKRHRTVVSLTPFQQQKLNHICDLFGLTYQRFFTDCVDRFYCEMLEVQSGRINETKAMQDSMLALVDELVKLRTIKGLVPSTPYHRHTRSLGE